MKLSPKHWYRLWREPWRKQFWDNYYRFRRENGEAKRAQLPEMDATSIALDFGGFAGEWAADIHAKTNAQVHVFEPHPTFAAAIENRFKDTPAITTHALAIGHEDGTLGLSDDGDASSAVADKPSDVSGKVVAARTFFAEFPRPVALAKINIEGGEYVLLPALADADFLQHINVLQIQFHLYQETDSAARDAIRETLSKTHRCDWEYPFVWEQWSRL